MFAASAAARDGELNLRPSESSAAATRATQFAEHDMALRVQPYVIATVKSRRGGSWVLHLINEGNGLALNGHAHIEFDGVRIQPPQDRILPAEDHVKPLRHDAAADLTVPGLGVISDTTVVVIAIEFADVLGQRYRVEQQYLPVAQTLSMARWSEDKWSPVFGDPRPSER